MKRLLILLCLFSINPLGNQVFSQEEREEIYLTKEQWQLLYDKYAVMAIKLLAQLDTLNKNNDSLNSLILQNQGEFGKCENEIYSIVGTTTSEIVEYRRKFEETEKKINYNTGSPADSRIMYFDDISYGKIKCLPEFYDRYISMKKKLDDWEGKKESVFEEQKTYKKKDVTETTYIVEQGDCLSKISELLYNSPKYWQIIWEANKNGVLNEDEITSPPQKIIPNPNNIYPGQVLRIPTLKSINK